MNRAVASVAALLVAAPLQVVSASVDGPVTIEDIVGMTQFASPPDDEETAVFSDDGAAFVTMTFRGDIQKNTNDFKLWMYDAANLDKSPELILSTEFSHDATISNVRPLNKIVFQDRTVYAIGTLDGDDKRQLLAIDLHSHRVQALSPAGATVRSFALSKRHSTLVYAVADETTNLQRKAEMIRNGFSLFDPAIAPPPPLTRIALGQYFWPRSTVELRFRNSSGHETTIYRDDALADLTKWSMRMSASPDGRWALVHPYRAIPGGPESLGLIDLSNGRVETLVAADQLPYSQRAIRGKALWSPDSQALLLETRGRIVEISVPRRTVKDIGVPSGWALLGWRRQGRELLLFRKPQESQAFGARVLASVERREGGYIAFSVLNSRFAGYELNPHYAPATNGAIVVGVRDSITQAPELAAFDFKRTSGQTLTDLNPTLRTRSFGTVERFWWKHDKEAGKRAGYGDSYGYLIKPVGFEPGRRYPLIILVKDESYDPKDDSFIFDAPRQSSAGAIQVWANQGFLVLLSPFAPQIPGGSGELAMQGLVDDVDLAIERLDSLGLVEPSKIGLSGWSGAGDTVAQLLARSPRLFAAAATVDNDGFTFMVSALAGRNLVGDKGDPWTDDEARVLNGSYSRVRTPRLIEVHQDIAAINVAQDLYMLRGAKIPVDLFIYPAAPHNLNSPVHRLRSLETNTDWFNFWLRGVEDTSAPGKRSQYERWRAMRIAAHEVNASSTE